MRRALPLLLSFLLVCAQGAGLWHGIGHSATPHAGSPLAAAARVDVSPASATIALAQAPAPADSADGRCDKCFQFAHFSGAAAPQLAILAVDETTHPRALGIAAALVARDAPPTRSRGPPVFL